MNTVELQKLAARKLKFSAQKTMQIAEELYNKGFMSYPRTETDQYNFNDDELKQIAEAQVTHPKWGNYANELYVICNC